MPLEHEKAATYQEEEDLLRAVAGALKVVKLYPPNNPVFRLSLEKLVALLNEYLVREPTLAFTVQKDRILYHGQGMGRGTDLIRGMSHDLYCRGVRGFSIAAGVHVDELLEFFRLFTLTQDDIKLAGGIEALLWEKNLPHLRVKESALGLILKGVDLASDMLAGEGIGIGDRKTQENVTDFLLSRMTALAPEEERLLFQLIEDPKVFALLLQQLASQKEGEEENQSGEKEDRIIQALLNASRAAERELPEEREKLHHLLAESLQGLEEPVADAVLGKLFLAHQEEGAEALLGQLPGRDLAEAVERLHLSEEIPFPVLRSILQQLPLSPLQREETMQVLQQRLGLQTSEILPEGPPGSQPDEGSPPTATQEREEEGLGAQAPRSKEAPPSADASRGTASAVQELEEIGNYRDTELAVIQEFAEAGQDEDTMQATVATLLDLLPLHDEHALYTRSVRTLQELYEFLLEQGKFRLARTILEGFKVEADPIQTPHPGKRDLALRALEQAGGIERLRGLLAAMTTYDKTHSAYDEIASLILAFDRTAIPPLIEILAEERQLALRKTAAVLLAELGRRHLKLLGERLGDGRWYLVRNLVAIFGEIGDERGIDYLRGLQDHLDARVRREVVRSLGMIGGGKAARQLLAMLKDRDLEVQRMTIQWSVTVGDPAMLPSLIEIASQGSVFSARKTVLQKEAVEALGKFGSGDPIPLLASLVRKRWWFRRKTGAEIRNLALSALREIGTEQALAVVTGRQG
jgi:HEAT repeat protein